MMLAGIQAHLRKKTMILAGMQVASNKKEINSNSKLILFVNFQVS